MRMMRPATLADADDLFAWRNDPETCANSRSTAAVPRSEHDRWMQFHVAQGYPAHIVMIAEDSDFGSVGVVRFDALRSDVMRYEAGITMAPKYRGMGWAGSILAQACNCMQEITISAEIRRENHASRHIFERCGFDEVGRDAGFIKYRREPTS